MIVDRTNLYIQLRGSNMNKDFKTITTNIIRSDLRLLDMEIQVFKVKLEKNKLPSFQSKDKKRSEIKIIKDRIESNIRECTIKIKEVQLSSKPIAISIQEYFFKILKKKIIEYKEIEAKCVIEEVNSAEEENIMFGQDTQDLMERESTYKSNNVRTSLIALNNSINQLKNILSSQTSMIDTIDLHFDMSNVYLEQANKEIDKIPGNYTAFKDKIIYFLLYVICILMAIVLYKVYQTRIGQGDKLGGIGLSKYIKTKFITKNI